MRLPCGFLPFPRREPGGRGRIRTFVARKERQIYSLLVLTAHPPVPQGHSGSETRILRTFPTRTTGSNLLFNNFQTVRTKTQIGLVSRDTSPLAFAARFRSASLPRKLPVELAEGIEPPTL